MKTIFLFCCVFPLIISAQDSLNRTIFLNGLVSYDIPRGYGFTFSSSAPFRSIHTKSYLKKEEFISAETGVYRYQFENTSIFVNVGAGIRLIRSEKHFTELSFSQGVLRTFYDGKVYTTDENGNIKELTLFGRTYLTSRFAYSMNYRINKGSSHLWFIQLRPSLWIQYPYNSFVKPHFSFEAGINYSFKNHRSKY